MNQRGAILPIVVITVVIMLGGVGWYVASRQSKDSQTDESNRREQASVTDTEGVQGTFEDLFALGRDVQCTFSGGGNKGTFFIDTDQQRMRGDFVMQNTNNGPVRGHIINDSEYVYTWTDGESQGVQLAVPEGKSAIATPAPDNGPPAYQELNKNYEYDCDAWRVDESLFALPEGINFLNVAEQFQQIQQQDQPAADCSVCEQATGPAKEQCLQALGCL